MKKGASSDYIAIKKQNAIYEEIPKNASIYGTTDPLKPNGQTYNNNLTILEKNIQDSGGKNIKYVKF